MPSAADMTQPKPLAMPADTGSRDGYISRPKSDWTDNERDIDEQSTLPRHDEIHVVEPGHGDENFSISQSNQDLIRKALEKHNGNRKKAAEELGISERTLYRKLPPEFRNLKKADE